MMAGEHSVTEDIARILDENETSLRKKKMLLTQDLRDLDVQIAHVAQLRAQLQQRQDLRGLDDQIANLTQLRVQLHQRIEKGLPAKETG
jgi:hypothetical protein